MSSAGAVTLKMAVAVCVDPMAMQFKATLKKTTNQTALTGVWVLGLTVEINLDERQALA